MPTNNLIKKLDKIFSVYIRVSSSVDGFVKCCTCGKPGHWKTMDCGHFIPRKNISTRYLEQNCAPQCKDCNEFYSPEKIAKICQMIEEHDGEWDEEELEKFLIQLFIVVSFILLLNIYILSTKVFFNKTLSYL